jgi:GNAT superfamily N-acetyltransferase
MSSSCAIQTAVVKIRPWRDGDLEQLRDAEPSFSPATLTSRFMIGTRDLPRAYLAALRRRSQGDRRWPIEVAFADGELVAVGEGFVDAADAEIALFVADAWQRRGVGARLLASLLERLRSAGVTHVTAETTMSNTSATALADWPRRSNAVSAKWRISSSTGPGVHRYVATYDAGAEAA